MINTISALSKQIHEEAKAKGFWDTERNIGELLMLITSELAEALEADRKDRIADCQFINEMDYEGYTWKDSRFSYTAAFEKTIKDTFEDEIADAVIRLLDLAAARGINLEFHIKHKLEYNKTRPYKHGKKY